MDNFQGIDPKYLALIQAGMGILAANNGRQPAGATIGQGLLGGTNAYQQNLLQQQEAALRKQEMDMRGQEFDWKKKEFEQKSQQKSNEEKVNEQILRSLGIGLPTSDQPSSQINYNVLQPTESTQIPTNGLNRDTLYKLGVARSLTGGHGGDALIKYADMNKPNWQNVGGKLVDVNNYQGEIPISPAPMSLAEKARLQYEGVIPSDNALLPQQPVKQPITTSNYSNLSPKAQNDLAVKKAEQDIVNNSPRGLAEQAKIKAEQVKTEQENATLAEKKQKNIEAQQSQANLITSKIDEALNLASGKSTGFVGSQMKKFAGTDAYDLEQAVLTVKANIGFQELQAMRANSPTGGALGQVAVQELQALQATLGSLDVGQSKDKLIKNLNAVKTHYQNVLDTIEGKMPTNLSNKSTSGKINQPKSVIAPINGKKVPLKLGADGLYYDAQGNGYRKPE